jgi:chromosome segregation ATPase
MCRGDLAMHQQKCPMFPTLCPGNAVGCSISDARQSINEHAKACPMAIMAPTFQEQDNKNATLRQQNSQLRELLLGLDSKLEEMETNFRELSTSIKREHRRSLESESTVPISRLEEITNRVEELATDYNSRLDNATSESARLHVAFMNENIRTQQQLLTMNGSLSALRAHIAHLAASRAAGNNASTGTSTTSGSSVVSIDSGRREPPKL